MKVTTKYIISAIIGYWRMGATINEIYQLTDVAPIRIKMIISKYEAASNDREREA